MHYTTSPLALALTSGLCVLAQTAWPASLSTDAAYSNPSTSLESLACSSLADGGKYPTLGSLPGSPLLVGAFYTLQNELSICGVCYYITYPGAELKVLAVDIPNFDGEGAVVLPDTQKSFVNESKAYDVTFTALDSFECGLIWPN